MSGGDLTGRTIVLTGASSGIGASAAVTLAGRGATVVPLGRDEAKLARVAQQMREAGQREVHPIQADLSLMSEVRRVAAVLLAAYPRIDVLVNNAGVIEPERVLTSEGFERTVAINHLAPFLMTRLLLDRLRESAPARVVTTSSDAYRGGTVVPEDLNGEQGWSSMRCYSTTKLQNALFSLALASRLDGTGVTSNCFHPGLINTGWGRDSWWIKAGKVVAPFLFRTPASGARSLVFLAADEAAGGLNGAFLGPSTAPMRLQAKAMDAAMAERLWIASEKALDLPHV